MLSNVFFRYLFEDFHIFHDLLNISGGKKRLRQSIYELLNVIFLIFKRISKIPRFLEHFRGEKASAAEYIQAFKYDFSDYSNIFIFFKIC